MPPFERAAVLFRHMREYARQLVADIPDDDWAAQPAEGMNHPAYLLGHLAGGHFMGAGFLGSAAIAPEWLELCHPGRVPSPRRADYPEKAEIVAAFEASCDALLAALPAATDEWCAGPHSVEALKPHLPTRGDVLGYILTTHIGVHLGQLSAWRRAVGMRPAAGGKAAGPEEVGAG